MHWPDPIMPTWVDVKNVPRIIHTDSGDLGTGVMSVIGSRGSSARGCNVEVEHIKKDACKTSAATQNLSAQNHLPKYLSPKMLLLQNILLALGATLAAAWKPQPSAWWKEGVVYQVYPSSFKESRTENAIGWGDIKGITDNLDHIQSLGADIVWLSPFYDSPMKDMGYDISNYDSVNKLFGGSIEDIKAFIEEAHKRGMRCIFDLVINHTSDKHNWFKQSASSKTNSKRDWYFWRQPQQKNGSIYPPNNWLGNNNGSAWTYDAHTGEYYLNIFNYYQPDLNWDNPDTRQAIFKDALEYWLDMGIDGFRMDVFARYSKPAGLPDVPANDTDFHDASDLYTTGPHEHEYLQQMNREVLSKYDTFTVGEYTVEN